MDKAQALHSFWSGFGIDAWDENTVPESAVYPRITYDVAVSDINQTNFLAASIWYRSTSWSEITAKAEEIGAEIGSGGKLCHYNNGVLWITKGEPFYQRIGDPDQMIRRIRINIAAEFISAE